MAKPIIFGVFFFVVVAIFYGIHYSTEVDEIQRDLLEAKREVGQMEAAIAKQEVTTAQRRELAALLQASEILSTKNNAIRDEIRALEQSERRIADDFLRVTERVRAETVGLTMDEMALTNGRVLKRVRVQAVDQSEITVLHSEGVSKVVVEELPDSLKERLRVGVQTSANAFRPSQRPDASATERMVALGREGSEEKKKSSNSGGDVRVDGDPALWNSVTRHSLGRAFVPGQGWLEVGPKGPIPGSGK